MASIPADTGLVLGNLITSEKREYLLKMTEARRPLELAQKKLQNLTLSTHKLEQIYQDMVNAGVEEDALEKLDLEVKTLKKQMSKAAIELGNASITSESKVREIERRWGHRDVIFNFESPIDFSRSEIKKVPLSYDSTNMDINYFRNEIAKSGAKSSSLATKIYKYVSTTYSSWSTPAKAQNLGKSAHKVLEQQTQNHEVDGVIVICAHCTHKQAEVYDPMVLNPLKALHAWNATFPDDTLSTDKKSIAKIANIDNETKDNGTEEESKDEPSEEKASEGKGSKSKPSKRKTSKSKNFLHLITGATYGSSFVGFVHIKKSEDTKSAQSAESLANALNQVASEDGFADSKSFGRTAKNLVSKSHIDTQCSLVTEGIIPNIAADSIPTAVASLKPDPKEIMGQLKAIQEASTAGVNNTMESRKNKEQLSLEFMKLNNSYLETTISSLGEYNIKENKTFNLNSLMTAFTDYVGTGKKR